MKMITGAFSAFVAMAVAAAVCVAGEAPGFSLTDTEGNTHSLSDFAGKTVVLEWTNQDCPFVKKHYNVGNMQTLQKKYTGKGVVWLTICSSAEGKQGYYDAEKWNAMMADKDAAPTAVLLDASGDVGRAYGAKTTPHMFVINDAGVIVYQGAIDSVRSTDSGDIEGAENYVASALDSLLQGKEVATAKTAPYGCSVKY